jgi:hypothetical protein
VCGDVAVSTAVTLSFHKSCMKPRTFLGSLVRIDDPYIDRCPWGLARPWKALDRLDAVDSVIGRLKCPPPCPCAEDALHCIERGLDEVIQIPDLVRIAGRSKPELQANGETRGLRLRPARNDGRSNSIFPRLFVGCGEGSTLSAKVC